MSTSTLNSWARLRGFYRRKVASILSRESILIHPQRPLISFTFDDFPRSALLAGGAILNHFGAAATYYASFGLLGKESSTGQMFVSNDLQPLLDQGHELGCHTFDHCDSWDTAPVDFENSIIANVEALHRFLPSAEFRSFSYPISLPRPLTKARVARHFACCRGGGQTLNTGTVDINQLSAFFLEKSRHDFQAVRIIQAQSSSSWLAHLCDARHL